MFCSWNHSCQIRSLNSVCQVASDTLPGCTERCVTVSGGKEAITQCIYHICCVMLGG